jgi:mono/diheme cytochrome c family protein
MDANVDAPRDGAAPDAAPGFDGPAGRGQYLAAVLNCGACHTPRNAAGAADNSMLLAGRDCLVAATTLPGFDGGATDAGSCLSSGNLTNDVTGIRGLTDQQVIDAIRRGVHQSSTDAGARYLFNNMPYFNYATLNDDDARAIVAYLRAIPAIPHQVTPATPPYDQRPTAPQNAPVDLTRIPNPGAGAPAGAANGKYLGVVACLACHTVPAVGAMPARRDETKAWQGGLPVRDNARMVDYQTPNLTPDATGIMGWTTADLVRAMNMNMDRMGRTFCANMRAFPLTASDATDIASYLLSIPPVANMRTMTCQ